MELFAALLTVLAWGLWLIPSQRVRLGSQQVRTFFVASTNLVLALVFAAALGSLSLSPEVFWPPFAGGVLWSLGGLGAFIATERLGIARAFGLWAPLNIVVSLCWGGLLFHEFEGFSPGTLVLLTVAVAVLGAGVLLIIFAKEKASPGRGSLIGSLAALAAGVFWGSYFLPIKASSVGLWTAAWPMAAGMFAGSLGLLFTVPRRTWVLEKKTDALRLGLTGLLWGLGNYGSLMLVDLLGASRGFTIAQVSIVVAALVSVFFLKEPPPGTRSAWLTLLGCLLATAGGIVLGNLR